MVWFKQNKTKQNKKPTRRFKKRLPTSAFSTSKGEHPHPHFIILQGSLPSIDTKHSSYCEKDAIGERGNVKRIMTTINTLYKNILKKLPLTQRYPKNFRISLCLAAAETRAQQWSDWWGQERGTFSWDLGRGGSVYQLNGQNHKLLLWWSVITRCAF